MHACVCACVFVYMRACVCACVRARVKLNSTFRPFQNSTEQAEQTKDPEFDDFFERFSEVCHDCCFQMRDTYKYNILERQSDMHP